MITFLRSQTASFTASVVDLLVTIGLVEFFGVWYGTAHVLGNVGGAVTNFLMGRFWVFQAEDKPPLSQAWKYALVWMGYVTVSFLLLIAVTEMFHIDYRIAKVSIAVMLSVTYNYQLQKKFIFK